MMKVGFWVRLDIFARSLTPFLMTLVLVLLQQVPLHVPDYAPVVPMLTLISIYYWVIFRPDLMPMSAAFTLGLFQDLLAGGVIGVSPFVFLVAHAMVGSQRKFFHNKGFGIIWWGFMLVGILVAFLQWFLVCLIERALLSPMPVLFSYLMSLAFFPILGVALWAVHKTLPQRG